MTVYEYDLKGYELLIKEDWDGAIEWYTTALAEHPDDSYLISRRASAWVRKGEPEKALVEYTRQINKYPRPCAGHLDGFNHRGLVYHEIGEYDKAIADFTECISMSPEGYGAYWSNRGISYYKKGDLDAAMADFNTSIATWRDPESTGWALLHRGMVWREKGELAKALADFRRAATRSRNDGDPLYQAGYIWFLRKKHEKAIAYFSKAIEKQNDVSYYWLARGACYWNSCVKNKINYWGEGGETINLARDDFTKAIECDPKLAEAWFNRGIVRGSMARENHNLVKAILADKATDEAQRILLMAQLEHIGGHDYVPQFDALLRGLRSNRDEVDVIMANMTGLFAEDDAREAVEDLNHALELEPDNAEAWYQRGLVYVLLGERDKALADYEQTLVLNPDHDKAARKRDALLEESK
jgi:tetratricopeptide (TPR) repeat protein